MCRIRTLGSFVALTLLQLLCACGEASRASSSICTEAVSPGNCQPASFAYSLNDALAFYDAGTIPVFADPTATDYIAQIDPVLGPRIRFNPSFLQQIGPDVHAFFIAHEVGHHYLSHLVNHPDFAFRADLAKCLGYESDSYVTRVLSQRSPQAVSAAIQWFSQQGNQSADQLHPNSCARTDHIQQRRLEANSVDPSTALDR